MQASFILTSGVGFWSIRGIMRADNFSLLFMSIVNILFTMVLSRSSTWGRWQAAEQTVLQPSLLKQRTGEGCCCMLCRDSCPHAGSHSQTQCCQRAFWRQASPLYFSRNCDLTECFCLFLAILSSEPAQGHRLCTFSTHAQASGYSPGRLWQGIHP